MRLIRHIKDCYWIHRMREQRRVLWEDNINITIIQFATSRARVFILWRLQIIHCICFVGVFCFCIPRCWASEQKSIKGNLFFCHSLSCHRVLQLFSHCLFSYTAQHSLTFEMSYPSATSQFIDTDLLIQFDSQWQEESANRGVVNSWFGCTNI
jgi:hypothetical protein